MSACGSNADAFLSFCSHVEGKNQGLASLPPGLFASMKWLTFIHLAVHPVLPELPSFDGLENLKVLFAAMLLSIRELPSFQPLTRVERLGLIALPSLETIPDMAPLHSLSNFELTSRGIACCNGFLHSVCDLSHPFCVSGFMLPAATCLNASDAHATQSTLAVFQRFSLNVCQVNVAPGLDWIDQASVDVCGGVLYRQCPEDSNGLLGICYPIRMQVISCIHEASVIEMRKEQIRLRIGASCNATEERWLGCTE